MRLRADGTVRCQDCASDPEDGRRRCASCAAAHAARERVRVAERKSKKLCVVCGAKAKNGTTLCPAHVAYYAEHNKAHRAKKKSE